MDIVSPGVGFEVCVVATRCKTSALTSPALGGQLNGPNRIAVDAAGNVYVADGINDRIQKYSATGVFERAWGEDVVSSGPGNSGTGFEVCVAAAGDVCQAGASVAPALGGEMNTPAGVATDAAGNVYVADSDHNRIQRFSPLGAFQRAWGENVAASGPGHTGGLVFEICVAANGDVCQTGVSATTAQGGDMEFPADVAVDGGGSVYVADRGQHRVQRFSSDGAFERAWGEDVIINGAGNEGFEICVAPADPCRTGETPAPALGGEMFGPTGVATDAAGHVYVADTQHDRIQRFSSDGTFERTWGEDVAGAGPGHTGTGFEICAAATDTCQTGIVDGQAFGGEFSAPLDVGADNTGSVYVADSGLHRIQKFNADGIFERAWGEDVITPGPADTGAGFEVCIVAAQCQTGGAAPPAYGGEMNGPTGVAADAAGNLYVVDPGHNRIQRFADPPPPDTGQPPGQPPQVKSCKRGQKLKNGKCVKKKRKKKKGK